MDNRSVLLNVTAAAAGGGGGSGGSGEESFRLPWQVGLGVSCASLLLQLAVLASVPAARRRDEIVLTQLGAARLANAACEYCIVMDVLGRGGALVDIVYVLCMYTDFALVCWMFVFSKNLYDKVVVVFGAPACALGAASALVWGLALPPGLLALLLLKLGARYFLAYYYAYAVVKFLIVTTNALLFVRIFAVARRRGAECDGRSLGAAVRAAGAATLLVVLTSAQVAAGDLLALAGAARPQLAYTFCVVNSFQPVLVTLIFFMLTKSTLRFTITRAISLKLTEVRKL